MGLLNMHEKIASKFQEIAEKTAKMFWGNFFAAQSMDSYL